MADQTMRACPFCGAHGDDLVVLTDVADFGSGAAVMCNCCGAIGPSDVREAQAVALWNGSAREALARPAAEVRPC